MIEEGGNAMECYDGSLFKMGSLLYEKLMHVSRYLGSHLCSRIISYFAIPQQSWHASSRRSSAVVPRVGLARPNSATAVGSPENEW